MKKKIKIYSELIKTKNCLGGKEYYEIRELKMANDSLKKIYEISKDTFEDIDIIYAEYYKKEKNNLNIIIENYKKLLL